MSVRFVSPQDVYNPSRPRVGGTPQLRANARGEQDFSIQIPQGVVQGEYQLVGGLYHVQVNTERGEYMNVARMAVYRSRDGKLIGISIASGASSDRGRVYEFECLGSVPGEGNKRTEVYGFIDHNAGILQASEIEVVSGQLRDAPPDRRTNAASVLEKAMLDEGAKLRRESNGSGQDTRMALLLTEQDAMRLDPSSDY